MVRINDNKPRKYKSNYSDLSQLSNQVNRSGRSPIELVTIQEFIQEVVAENPKWYVARKVNHVPGGYNRIADSKTDLEKLGFKILHNGEPVDDLFYEVDAPEGWDKITNGYWTNFRDENGRTRMSQFFKGSICDRDSFVNIQLPSRSYTLKVRIDNEDFIKRYDKWQQKLAGKFEIKAKNIEKFIDEAVKGKLFQELSFKVRDKLYEHAKIKGKQHDKCNLFQKFIWHYSYPIFEASDQKILPPGHVPAAFINGFEGLAPYPFALVKSYAPSFFKVKKQKTKLGRAKEVAQKAIDEHIALLSKGIEETTFFQQAQTLPSGLIIGYSTPVNGTLAVKDNKGVILSMESRNDDSFTIDISCGKDKSLETQLKDMTFVEKSVESGFNLLGN